MTTAYNSITQGIFEQLGIENLPSEDKAVLMSQMTELVLKRAMLKVADRLEHAKMTTEDTAVLETGSNEQKIEIVLKYVPEFITLIQAEIDELRTELTTLVQ